MNKTRPYLLILLAMLFLLALTGCTPGRQETDTRRSAAASSAADPAPNKEETQNQQDNPALETQTSQTGEDAPEEEPLLTGEISCLLPEDFVQYENNPGIFVCKDYPRDIACISYIIADYDGQEPEQGQDGLLQSIQESLKEDYGEEAQAEMESCENFRIGGHQAVKIRLTCRLLGTSYDMTQLIIFDGTNRQEHIFNFMQEKDGKWTEAFQESIDSVTFR